MAEHGITKWLRRTNSAGFSTYVILAAFSTYACMYAFRKPYTATGYELGEVWGLNYKTILVISQVLGYTVSKYAGIKFISEMRSTRRALSIVVLIGMAEVMLLGFGLVPHPYNFVFMFFNGLALGMIWGLVFSYLEGRRSTELLGAGLSVSFIVASGLVKSTGRGLMDAGVSEFWMPAATGALFVLPMLGAVWLLDKIPPPTKADESSRTKRVPMAAKDRWRFFRNFTLGLILLVAVYMLLTAFRDFRDNFMADMFEELGIRSSGIFAKVDTIVGLVLLGIMAATVLIRNHLVAFIVNHVLILLGFAVVGISTLLFEVNAIDPVTWMVLTGIGVFMGYIPFNCILFERLIATFRYQSNVGFLIYIADAFGYTASVAVLLYRDIGQPDQSWVSFFTSGSWFMVAIGGVLTLGSMLYFLRKKARTSTEAT